MRIVIEGQPIPKLRARHTTRGKFVCTYDPQNSEKSRVRGLMSMAYKQFSLSNYPELNEVLEAKSLMVCICFNFVPFRKSTRDYNRKLWNLESHISRPDVDNLAKFYLDCCNGIFWSDDKIISSLYLKKAFSETQSTEIFIMPKQPPDLKDYYIITECFSPIELQKFLEDSKDLGDVLTNISEDAVEKSLSLITEKIVSFVKKHGNHISKVKKNISKKDKSCPKIQNS